MHKGYVHIYTGNGKGKTTAAFCLAVRAACYGKRVYIGQFVKDMQYHETKLEEYLPNIKIEQLGVGCFIDRDPTAVDKEAAQNALQHCAQLMRSQTYDLVILDEINIAIYFQLITSEEVIAALGERGEGVEVVLTGRYAPDELIAAADLVTEMKEVKHYYRQGVLSRPGIDF